MIRKFGVFILVLFLVASCDKKNPPPEIKIITGNSGFGYEIIKNKQVLIHQPYIPAAQNEQEFKDPQQAKQIAVLVIKKLGQHKYPTITLRELDSLKIEYIK